MMYAWLIILITVSSSPPSHHHHHVDPLRRMGALFSSSSVDDYIKNKVVWVTGKEEEY